MGTIASMCSWVLRSVHVGPLSIIGVNAMVNRIAHVHGEAGLNVAKALHDRTMGNPLKVVQLIRLLYEGGSLKFDIASGLWAVDHRALETLPLVDDTCDAVSISLAALPPGTQHMLSVAACLGDRIPLSVVSAPSAEPLLPTSVALAL